MEELKTLERPGSSSSESRELEKQKNDEEDQVALITGCASGIGLGTALAFASLNYKLVLVDERPDELSRCALLCMERSSRKYQPLELALDLSEGEQVARLVVKETLAHFKRLDVLINNAGVSSNLPSVTKFNDEQNCIPNYHRIIAHNMHASVYLCLAAYEPLKATKGSIVNVSSVLDDQPAEHRFAYCMSKAALTMLTKCLARDFAPNVRVNCVSPGPIANSILDDMGASSSEARDSMRRRRESDVSSAGSTINGEQVARMIVYLASKDKAAFITGSRVLVDGGWTVRAGAR